MRIRVGTLSALFAFILVSSVAALHAQQSANSNATYQQLRDLMPGNDVTAVSNLVLHRDAATFTFYNGTIAFFSPVNGKVTGAVFEGKGHLHITPPTDQEKHNLSLFNHTEEFDEDFDQVVLRFTDDTAAELRKASAGKGTPDGDCVKAAKELQGFGRHQLHDNFDLRLLEDVLSPAPGGFFLAYMHGAKDSHLLFEIDPHGVSGLAPEEVALINWRWRDGVETYPLAFHRAAEYANGTASGNEHNAAYKILHEDLDTTIERNGFLSGVATVEVSAAEDGVAVIPFDLYANKFASLAVSKVETDTGAPLDFVQENKSDDPDFGVVLAKPLMKGETATLKVTYGGKDVVFNEGGDNYYPVAREDWFPNADQGFGDYATYEMTFHVPKGLQLVATGTKVGEKTDGKETTTEWKTDEPLPVVGFTLGDFKEKDAAFNYPSGGGLTVDAYANVDPPDFLTRIANRGLGSLNTTPMLGTELNEGEAAAQVYTNYYGALPFSHIFLTQQSACNYGQSWPMLVYLVRPAWAHSYGWKSRHKLVTASEAKRNCMRATECGKEAWSEAAGR